MSRGGKAPPAEMLPGCQAARVLHRRRETAALALGHAADALAGLQRGGHVFGLTKGQFSMIDVAAALLDRVGPARLSIWTWCIAAYEVAAVTAFMADRRVTGLRMVMDYSAARRDMPLLADLQGRFGADCLRVTKTHAKILTIATDCGWQLVARGSMNLNFNPRFEQFDVTDGPDAFGLVAGLEDALWQAAPPVPVRRVSHDKAADLLATAGGPVDQPDWAAGLADTKTWW